MIAFISSCTLPPLSTINFSYSILTFHLPFHILLSHFLEAGREEPEVLRFTIFPLCSCLSGTGYYIPYLIAAWPKAPIFSCTTTPFSEIYLTNKKD